VTDHVPEPITTRVHLEVSTPDGAVGVDVAMWTEASGVVLRAEDGADIALAFGEIYGVVVARADARAESITVHTVDEVVRVTPLPDTSAAAFDALAESVVAGAFALPELMRSLRAFGSSRALPGAEHDRFFAPFIERLRALRVEHARSAAPWRAVDVMDATHAGAELRATLSALAADRYPSSPPDRRALEAELLDEAEDVLGALDALTAAAQRLGVAPEQVRVAAWREWCAAAANALAAADRCWARVVPALGAR
jgi:hypothetical protein